MLIKENTFVHFKFESPMLLVTVKNNKEPSDEEWTFTKETMMSFYNACLQASIKMHLCFDVRLMGLLSISKSMDWAKLFNQNKHKTQVCVLCTALVVNSDIVRTTINGYFMLYKPTRPVKFVKNIDEAQEFFKTIEAEECRNNAITY